MKKEEKKEAYPLQWPAAHPRCKSPAKASFKGIPFVVIRERLFGELKRLGAKGVVLSSNIPLKLDGYPYANFASPVDAGAAVYFQHKSRPMVFACDRWQKVEDNIHAIELTIAALRGIERWGASDMMERAFAGFLSLPAPLVTPRHWTEVLEVETSDDISTVEAAFREKMKTLHPDVGGTQAAAAELTGAIAHARSDLRGLS